LTLLPLLAIGWQEAAGWLALLNFVVAGFTLYSILAIKKETTSAVAWCLTVIFIPIVGLIIYWLFGYQSVQYPLRRKQKHAKLLRQRQVTADSQYPAKAEVACAFELSAENKELAALAQRLGASPVVGGNRLDFYHEISQAYEAMLEAIRTARHHIHLEIFIFRSDASGEKFISALAERARAGVQVRLLYDAVGSLGLRRTLLSQLTAAGGQASAFLTLINPLRRRIQINLRNHRKVLVVDGRVGFTGGANIGDEYLGLAPFFGHWRDTFMRLEGPAVRWLQRLFVEDWHFATNEELLAADYFPSLAAAGDAPVQVAWSGPDQEFRTIREIYFAAFMKARHRLWIASPYFVPDAGLLDALCLAARSGRDVRLLLPWRPDKWIPFLASRYYWREVLAAGVKIYQYAKGFIHAKFVIVDDDWASVGSANLDNRSLLLNFELTCLIQCKQGVTDLEAAFLRDLKESIRVSPEQFERRGFVGRFAENACRLLSPVL
jgi:cardiolipin synthase